MKHFLCSLVVSVALFGQSPPQTLNSMQVGTRSTTDGTIVPQRGSKTGGLVTSDEHGRFHEAVSRGNVYTATTIQATVATGNNSPLGAAGTPLVGVFNIASSGKTFSILRAVVCQASGTPAAQPLFVWNVIPSPAGITAAGTAGVNNLNFTANSLAKVFANAATTGSAAATALRPIGGSTSVASASAPACTVEDTAGEIVVPPGAFAGVAVGNGAGTTWIVSASITWEEVPIP